MHLLLSPMKWPLRLGLAKVLFQYASRTLLPFSKGSIFQFIYQNTCNKLVQNLSDQEVTMLVCARSTTAQRCLEYLGKLSSSECSYYRAIVLPQQMSYQSSGLTILGTPNVLAALNTLCICALHYKVGKNIGLQVIAKANLEALKHLCRLVSFKAGKKTKTKQDETSS